MPLIVGVFNGEGPPVPIPNTEVKLTSADNTCLETDREDRSMPTSKGLAQVRPFAFASLAQQVEHAAVNRRVVGSNPTGGAKMVLPSHKWRQYRHKGLELSWLEQPAHNRSVPGSSPGGPTIS